MSSTVVPVLAGAVEQVAILTDDGLQTVVLSKVKKMKFSSMRAPMTNTKDR